MNITSVVFKHYTFEDRTKNRLSTSAFSTFNICEHQTQLYSVQMTLESYTLSTTRPVMIRFSVNPLIITAGFKTGCYLPGLRSYGFPLELLRKSWRENAKEKLKRGEGGGG